MGARIGWVSIFSPPVTDGRATRLHYDPILASRPSDWGKIVRLTRDGGIPPDNPFAGKAFAEKGYRPEIYALGHRNPLGPAIDSRKGDLWSTEFGPRGGDELNLIKPGRNYG